MKKMGKSIFTLTLAIVVGLMLASVASAGKGGNKQYFYLDSDGDNYGDAAIWEFVNKPSAGYILDNTDCNDLDPTINPGAPEIFGDMVDQNCDGNLATFYDANLETCVLEHTGGIYTEAALLNLTTLECNNRSITDLRGLDNLTGVTFINFMANNISDLSPLTPLSDLSILVLRANNVIDISPLAGLTNLTNLNLRHNTVSDISFLSELVNLQYLELGNNYLLSDISGLQNLTNLTNLGLLSNDISNVAPLQLLTKLSWLNLGWNSISDLDLPALVPLLQNLQSISLYLGSNQLTDVSPLIYMPSQGLVALEFNCITDFSPVAHVNHVSGIDQQCL
jgi:Leucine-rich repeat (LRR) protein